MIALEEILFLEKLQD